MSTVRLYFSAAAAAAVLLLVVAIGWSATTDAAVCCNSSSVAVASCQNENRTFHAVETIGGDTCGDNQTAVSIRKCCPPDRPYDPEMRFCGPVSMDGDEYRRRMMQRLRGGFPAVANAVMVGYNYEPRKCDKAHVLVDLSVEEVRGLMDAADPSAVELPSDYCFDLTASDELVARTCRPREEYCGNGRYTCVSKCCKGDGMLVGRGCRKSQTPFNLSTYETDISGRPAGRSNSTVLTYYIPLACKDREQLKGEFTLTTDGRLYRADKRQHIQDIEYCVEYGAKNGTQVAPVLQAFVCLPDVQLPAFKTRGSWKYLALLAGFVPSVLCLALTLLVYITLSSLRNVHGYNVMCYVVCLLVTFSGLLTIQWMQDDINGQPCVLLGYFTLLAFLATFCWLNVICFDIYWMLRYNHSINRNRSISVRNIIYHIYCWGFSSIYACSGYLFQHSQHEKLLKIAPDIGEKNCWFSDNSKDGTLLFFILPVSVILTVNIIFFVLTAIHCSRIKSELNRFKRTDSKTQRFLVDKEKFEMSIKLFLVMGIPWIFEVLSKIFPNDWIIWDILDEVNALQGVMIFFIFVVKKKVLMNLKKKFRDSVYHSESTKMNTISGSSLSNSANTSHNNF